MPDEEIQAAQERAEAAQPGEIVEGEQAPEVETPETATAETEVPEAPVRTESDDRLARLERQNRELSDQIARLSQPQGPPPDDKPPVNEVKTMDDLLAVLDWRDKRLARQISAISRGDAQNVMSESMARGLFSHDSMGGGRDYDALVGKHITPVEQVDPGFARLFTEQPNPAVARYALATALEIIEQTKGDPVKGFRNLWSALDNRRTATRTVLKQVQNAAKAQVGATDLRGSRSGSSKDPAAQLDQDARTMTTNEFAKKYPHLVTG